MFGRIDGWRLVSMRDDVMQCRWRDDSELLMQRRMSLWRVVLPHRSLKGRTSAVGTAVGEVLIGRRRLRLRQRESRECGGPAQELSPARFAELGTMVGSCRHKWTSVHDLLQVRVEC